MKLPKPTLSQASLPRLFRNFAVPAWKVLPNIDTVSNNPLVEDLFLSEFWTYISLILKPHLFKGTF
jgi:hypothetical protein